MSGGFAKIRLRGLTKRFGDKLVLDGVDLDIRAGHGMVILGDALVFDSSNVDPFNY